MDNEIFTTINNISSILGVTVFSLLAAIWKIYSLTKERNVLGRSKKRILSDKQELQRKITELENNEIQYEEKIHNLKEAISRWEAIFPKNLRDRSTLSAQLTILSRRFSEMEIDDFETDRELPIILTFINEINLYLSKQYLLDKNNHQAVIILAAAELFYAQHWSVTPKAKLKNTSLHYSLDLNDYNPHDALERIDILLKIAEKEVSSHDVIHSAIENLLLAKCWIIGSQIHKTSDEISIENAKKIMRDVLATLEKYPVEKLLESRDKAAINNQLISGPRI